MFKGNLNKISDQNLPSKSTSKYKVWQFWSKTYYIENDFWNKGVLRWRYLKAGDLDTPPCSAVPKGISANTDTIRQASRKPDLD